MANQYTSNYASGANALNQFQTSYLKGIQIAMLDRQLRESERSNKVQEGAQERRLNNDDRRLDLSERSLDQDLKLRGEAGAREEDLHGVRMGVAQELADLGLELTQEQVRALKLGTDEQAATSQDRIDISGLQVESTKESLVGQRQANQFNEFNFETKKLFERPGMRQDQRVKEEQITGAQNQNSLFPSQKKMIEDSARVSGATADEFVSDEATEGREEIRKAQVTSVVNQAEMSGEAVKQARQDTILKGITVEQAQEMMKDGVNDHGMLVMGLARQYSSEDGEYDVSKQNVKRAIGTVFDELERREGGLGGRESTQVIIDALTESAEAADEQNRGPVKRGFSALGAFWNPKTIIHPLTKFKRIREALDPRSTPVMDYSTPEGKEFLNELISLSEEAGGFTLSEANRQKIYGVGDRFPNMDADTIMAEVNRFVNSPAN